MADSYEELVGVKFRRSTITKIVEVVDDYTVVEHDNAFQIFIEQGPFVPEIGHQLLLYGDGYGSPITGIKVNGVWFRKPEGYGND